MSSPRLLDRLRRRVDRIRRSLLAAELDDDPRHAWGRRRDEVKRIDGWRRAGPASPDDLPSLYLPPPEALVGLLPATVWNLTAPLEALVRDARQAGRSGIVISVELSSCLYSERLADALREGRSVWEDRFALLRLQPGDRLGKAYLRELQLGDVRFVLTSLPLCMVFDLHPDGLEFRALALDPLGPSRDHRKLRALIDGHAQLAPGAEQEVVRAWKQGHLIELERSRSFFQRFRIEGLAGGEAV